MTVFELMAWWGGGTLALVGLILWSSRDLLRPRHPATPPAE
jgi:hypothetical protein